MSEDKRHLDEEWDDLPLPDANAAWQKMEVLLDEDKKRRRVLPFWFWRSAGLGLLLVGLLAGGWFWLFKESVSSEPTSQAEKKETITTTEGQKQDITDPKSKGSQPKQQNEKKSSTEGENENHPVTSSNVPNNKATEDANHTTTRGLKETTSSVLKKKNQLTIRKEKQNRVKKKGTHPDLQLLEEVLLEEKNSEEQTVVQPQKSLGNDTLPKTSTVVTDSLTTKDTAAKKAAEPVATNEEKTDPLKKRSAFVFSAGIGLQQAIAIDGQQSSGYNYKGKKSSLSDHIPSVYFRVQKGKWFAQAEFQYGVPQPVKPFSFSQKTTYDVTSLNLNKEQFNIQKLYYHQLPVSINYFVLPNWSVGTGGVYNILAGAVTEQEVAQQNVLTGNMSASRNLAPVKGYKDSFLYKTTAGIIFQTDYHWKRFALGLRFTQNLQPFIKYTKPDGQIVDERNKVLQAVLRFQLWRSKRG